MGIKTGPYKYKSDALSELCGWILSQTITSSMHCIYHWFCEIELIELIWQQEAEIRKNSNGARHGPASRGLNWTWTPFCGTTDTTVFILLVTSASGLEASVDPPCTGIGATGETTGPFIRPLTLYGNASHKFPIKLHNLWDLSKNPVNYGKFMGCMPI